MTTLISAELFKLRSTRTTWATAVALAGFAIALLGFNAALLGDPGQPEAVPSTLVGLVRTPGPFIGAGALLFGLLLTSSEHRHGVALITRLGHPRLPSLILGKATAAAITGVVLAVAVEAIMVGGGTILLASRNVAVEPLRHGMPGVVAGVVAIGALYAIAGVGIGELLRNPALAVGVVLGWMFVAEGVLPVVLREPDVARWLPSGLVTATLSAGASPDASSPAPAAALAVLAAYAVGLLIAGLGRACATDP
ncbi:MAG TPA: hypothetical protein VF462_04690 [Micromonosporaceae bacterium]